MKYPNLLNASIEKTIIVTAEYSGNLPALAAKLYSNSNYWDLLYYANDLADPLEVPAGISLKVPKLAEAIKLPDPGVMR